MTGLTVTVELRKVKCLCSYVKLIETPLGIDYAMFDKLGAGRCNWVAAPVLFLGGCVGECVHSPQNNPKESEIRSVSPCSTITTNVCAGLFAGMHVLSPDSFSKRGSLWAFVLLFLLYFSIYSVQQAHHSVWLKRFLGKSVMIYCLSWFFLFPLKFWTR